MVSTIETASTVVPILVVVLVPTVRIQTEWCRPVAILLPVTLPFGLVREFGMTAPVAAYILLIGFPTLESKTKPTTNEQKYSSLVCPFELHTVAL